MTHTGFPKRVVFNPNDVDIYEISIRNLIAVGKENRCPETYEFSNFVPYSKPSAFLTHGNEFIWLWNERF